VTGARDLTILGDEDLLVTALRNLLENAVSYSPDKTRVVITTRAASSWTAEISVSDQGIGIPERDRERIFERFYRVDPARSRATGGTGLGLAIVKHVTAAHGGNVTVWSQEGVGSTFTLRLPLRPRRGLQAGPDSLSGEEKAARTDPAVSASVREAVK
jgi:two-component system sensor histidine kinase SenX3